MGSVYTYTAMKALIFVIAFCFLICVQGQENVSQTKFDVILFVQDWPMSDCISWRNSNGGKCSIKEYRQWTIRGIYPGRRDGKNGPQFCDKRPLNLNDLWPLMENLTMEWTNDHANPGSHTFWSYIWYRYGSCFKKTTNLEEPIQYFLKALEWHKKYPIHEFLQKHQILPGNSYYASDLYDSMKRGLYGKKPAIDCIKSANQT